MLCKMPETKSNHTMKSMGEKKTGLGKSLEDIPYWGMRPMTDVCGGSEGL